MALLRPEDQRFRVWSWDQMYFGGVETGHQVWPSVGDLVVNLETGIWSVVVVDNIGIPQLELLFRWQRDPSLSAQNDSIITAISEYQPSLTTPIFYDTTKNPYEMVVDTSYPIMDTAGEYMVFFKGTDVSTGGTVVSQVYVGDTIVDNKVELEEIYPGSVIQRPKPFTTKVVLRQNEFVTGVVFNKDDRPIGKRTFVVEESAAIRPASQNDNSLTGVSLKSDLIDPIDRTLIKNDLNIPFASSLTKAILHYADGTSKEIDIDGNKCVLRGLSDVNYTQAIKPQQFALMYFPDSNEPYVNAVGTVPHLVKHYRLQNIYKENSYGLKLYLIPEFIDVARGYKINFRLCSVERDVDIDVTDSVVVRKAGGVTFEPTNYGAEQILDCMLELDKVAPGLYPGFVFTERILLTVNLPGILEKDPWVIDYNTDGNNRFGLNAQASIGPGIGQPVRGNNRIHFGNDRGSVDNWLHQLYHTIEPIFDTSALVAPVTPTHFRYVYDGLESEIFEVGRWNDEIDMLSGIPAFEPHKTVTIVWLFRDGSEYGVLGHSPLMTEADLV
ncbi:hypothetical protein CZP2022_230 [Vibrio phage C-ZP2022]|nr:hypothetical protein CZP2022_230 [Vibrio phage C-ZP2022]